MNVKLPISYTEYLGYSEREQNKSCKEIEAELRQAKLNLTVLICSTPWALLFAFLVAK